MRCDPSLSTSSTSNLAGASQIAIAKGDIAKMGGIRRGNIIGSTSSVKVPGGSLVLSLGVVACHPFPLPLEERPSLCPHFIPFSKVISRMSQNVLTVEFFENTFSLVTGDRR